MSDREFREALLRWGEEETPASADVAVEEVGEGGAVNLLSDTMKFAITFGTMAAALAASFTHMHDWTVRTLADAVNVAPAEVTWYGWANAMISELVPLASLLSVRHRLRYRLSLWSYPLWLAAAFGLVSIFAQIAWVSNGFDGSAAAIMLATLPAVASIALTKLVMSDLDVSRVHRAALKKAEDVRRKEQERRDAEMASARAEAEEARERERKAYAEAAERKAEADRLRAEAEEAEAGRVQAEAEAETLRASSGRTEAEAGRRAEEARREADRVAGELTRLRMEHAATREDLAAAQEALSARTSPRARRTPAEPVTMPDGSAPPEVPEVSPVLVARVLVAHAEHPDFTQKALAELVGTSDRTVRKVLSVATPTAA
jgi:hypothetical protein